MRARDRGTWTRRVIAVATLVAALACVSAAAVTTPTRSAVMAARSRSMTTLPRASAMPPRRRVLYPSHLPAGEGRELAHQGCLVCHSAMLIAQQHKDSTAWEKTVGQMEKWGAPVPAGGHGKLLQYLVRNFGPAKTNP